MIRHLTSLPLPAHHTPLVVPSKKLLVVDIAALGWNLVAHLPEFRPAQSVFPAVTCTVQASLRTGALPQEHGMVDNGLFFRDLRKVLFWEQSAALVQGPRIWEEFRGRGGKVGLMFWQQSMGEAADLIVTPAPIHKHSGGMIQDCYTQPDALQARLNEAVGRPFNLMNYWGPLANQKSSNWIVDAIVAVMGMPEFAPDLLLTYIPHLDYDLQRFGPGSDAGKKALDLLLGYLTRLKAACADFGYDWLFFGDYAIEEVTRGAIFPNLRLREAGLFAVRDIRGMAYTDFFTSRAFAVADHQVAHVYCRDAESARAARESAGDAARGGGGPGSRSAGGAGRGAPEQWRSGARRRAGRVVRLPVVCGQTGGARLRQPCGYPQQAGLRPVRTLLRLAAGERELRHPKDPRLPRQCRPWLRDRLELLPRIRAEAGVAARPREGDSTLDRGER